MDQVTDLNVGIVQIDDNGRKSINYSALAEVTCPAFANYVEDEMKYTLYGEMARELLNVHVYKPTQYEGKYTYLMLIHTQFTLFSHLASQDEDGGFTYSTSRAPIHLFEAAQELGWKL